ncbi:MAG: hypothetical protein EKK52_20485 [Burkholderiales bacterium]|nr:MAG: hypothetical protein EKK52_20485 [Burkholderiales bacterium]
MVMSSNAGADLSQPPERRAPRWLQVALFLLIYAAFQWGYQSLRSSSWDHWFIHQLTVRPAAWLVDAISPVEAVRAVDYKLVWPGGGLVLRAGCASGQFTLKPSPMRCRVDVNDQADDVPLAASRSEPSA